MPILDAIAMGITPCRCNRLSTKRHCPYCGAYSYDGRAGKLQPHMDSTTGQTMQYQVYRCRRCVKFFDDWEWQEGRCQAPFFETATSRSRQRAKEIIETLPPNSAVAAVIAKLQRQRGINPDGSPIEGPVDAGPSKLDTADPLSQFGVATPPEVKDK